MFWYWFFAAPAALLALLSLRGDRRRAEYVARRLTASDGPLPPVTVIVPVKGYDEGLRENLAALASLDYPDYELIVTAHSANDIPTGVLPARVKIVLAHGKDPQTSEPLAPGLTAAERQRTIRRLVSRESPAAGVSSEKVQNLLAAVRAARKRSEVLAFADSDARPGKQWLRALVAPLAEPGVGASTGYRWFMPHPADFWSLVRAVWDAVAAGVLGPGDNRFAWGGAMAMRKERFFEARVPEFWQGAISDDYALTQAVHAMKWSIAYAPGALTPCGEHIGMSKFFSWTRRQMAITRAYSPQLWWPALIAHVFYCTAMAASVVLAVRGYWPAAVALAAQLVPGMWKGLRRVWLARKALPEYDVWFRKWAWVHVAFVPLGTWAWLAALGSSAFVRRIEWRGRHYELKRRGPV